MTEELLNQLFTSRSFTYRHKWEAAYPFLRPTVEFPPFKLGERLYYNNAVESMLSVLEASAIAAHNNAGLLAKDLQNLL